MSLPPNKNLLKEFPNSVFCETGIFRGDSLQLAIEADFKTIIGIDNDKSCIDFCKNRFDLVNKKHTNIDLHYGNSADDLWTKIIDIKDSITFFLDAHWQMLEGTEKGDDPFPLMDEIWQIARHPIKTHTIIIDDLLYLTHPDITGWTKKDIIDKLKDINPDYKFNLIANPVINNMLVAWI